MSSSDRLKLKPGIARTPPPRLPRGNSGCLLHISGEHKIWPKSIEVEGSQREHGRLRVLSGARGEQEYFKADELKKVRLPVGEWNTTEITCRDGTVAVHVNGVAISKPSARPIVPE